MKATKVIFSALAMVGSTVYGQMAAEKTASLPISANYINEMVGPSLVEDDSAFESYHYFTVKANLPDTGFALSLVGTATSTFGDGASKEETIEGNHYIKIHSPAIFEKNGFSVTPQLRAYLPTSKSSKGGDKDLSYSPRLYVSGAVGKLNLTYILIPGIYTYTNTLSDAQIAENDEQDKSRRVNFTQGHYFSASYDIGASTSLDFDVYPKWTYMEGSKAAYNDLNIIPGISQKMSDAVSASLWVDTYAVNYAAKRSSLGATLSVTLM